MHRSHRKNQLISELIECKKDCKVVKICEELPKGNFIESIGENFILELEDDMRDQGGVTLIDLLKHLRKEYVHQDVDFLEKV